MRIWSCKIGNVEDFDIPPGSDLPMRSAVERAFKELTGKEAHFNFSGWGDQLTADEIKIVRGF